MAQNQASEECGSERPNPIPDHEPPQCHQAEPLNVRSVNFLGEWVGLLGSEQSTYGTVAFVKKSPGTLMKIFCFIFLLGAIIGNFVHPHLNEALHKRLDRQWADEEMHREMTRNAWAVEVRKHEELKLKMDEMRQRWAREREEERRERGKKRESIVWEGIEAGHCLRYGVKEYIAAISQVPLGLDSIEECWKKPISIHGRQWLPSRCERDDQCPSGRVTGHWEIDAHEVSCTPYWGTFIDKGCARSGIRRYEAHLMNVQDATYWEAICSTAPANINGKHYDGPTTCENWLLRGIWGIWFVEDETCR